MTYTNESVRLLQIDIFPFVFKDATEKLVTQQCKQCTTLFPVNGPCWFVDNYERNSSNIPVSVIIVLVIDIYPPPPRNHVFLDPQTTLCYC